MKDEEMAEEIANKRCHEIMCYGHCSFNSPKHHRCGEWHREYNCALEGLKAGRPQWHDLRKDPKDLPKEFDINKNKWEMEKRITKHIVQNECGERVFCFNGTWYHEKGGEAHPIAWCEIPTFDKE